MAFVARPAAAADAPAQASAPGARRRPMLQAERALRAAARPRRAAALWSHERDASDWRPWGPPRHTGAGRPPLEGAGEVVHQKAVVSSGRMRAAGGDMKKKTQSVQYAHAQHSVGAAPAP